MILSRSARSATFGDLPWMDATGAELRGTKEDVCRAVADVRSIFRMIGVIVSRREEKAPPECTPPRARFDDA